MRAKNEFRFLAEAYDTKLILERIVDGKLMCPEACCGAPVIECTCGEDCPHCNCFMIHKAMKSNGLTDKLLKEFYKMRDPEGDGSWPDDERDEERRKNPDYGEPEEYGEDEDNEKRDKNREFADSLWSKDPKDLARRRRAAERVLGKRRNPRPAHLFTKEGSWRAKKDSEDSEEIEYENPATRRKEAQRAANERAHKKWQDPEYWKKFGVKGLGPDTPKEDNEEPRRGISGYEYKPDPMIIAHREEMARLKKIDLSKWRDHIENNPKTGVDDIMKKVHKQYPKASLPSKYSKDYDIVWDKKVRPFLMHEFPDN